MGWGHKSKNPAKAGDTGKGTEEGRRMKEKENQDPKEVFALSSTGDRAVFSEDREKELGWGVSSS